MAPSPFKQPTQHKPYGLVRIIGIVLVALVLIAGLAVLITWLVVRPRKLVYAIEEGSVHNFGYANNHLNATFDIVLRADNPNRKISIYYDSIQASVAYQDQTLAFTTIPGFIQPRKNATRQDIQFSVQNVTLFGHMARDLKLEKSSGAIELEIKIVAIVRFVVDVWKSNHRTMRVKCFPVVVNFSSSKGFHKTRCDVDL